MEQGMINKCAFQVIYYIEFNRNWKNSITKFRLMELQEAKKYSKQK